MKTTLQGCYDDLALEIRRVRKLNSFNQKHFAPGTAVVSRLTKSQLHMLTESVFFSAFRAYERFLRNVFLLFCRSVQPPGHRRTRCYLSPKNNLHAEKLLKSTARFLDWGGPEQLIERAEIFLEDGFPVVDVIRPRLADLRDLKRLRNHIAHMSDESQAEYEKTLITHYGTIPLSLPRPGEFLLLNSRKVRGKYYLQQYFDLIEGVAEQLAVKRT